MLGFIVDFIDTHVTPDTHLTETDEQARADAMRGIRRALGAITALVNQRMERLRHVLNQAWTTAWCPECGQPAVLPESGPVDRSHGPEDDRPRCVFCTARRDLRSEYVSEFTGSGWICPATTRRR